MRGTLLLVEDHALTRRAIVRRVERTFDCRACGSIAEAEAALVELAPTDLACVVADIRLDDGSGLDLLERHRPAIPAVPIAVVTGQPPDRERITALDATLMLKPYIIEPLDAFLHRVASQRAAQRLSLDEAVKQIADDHAFDPHETHLLATLASGVPLDQLPTWLATSAETLKTQLKGMRRKMGGKMAGIVTTEDMVLRTLRLAHDGHRSPLSGELPLGDHPWRVNRSRNRHC